MENLKIRIYQEKRDEVGIYEDSKKCKYDCRFLVYFFVVYSTYIKNRFVNIMNMREIHVNKYHL